MKRGDIQLELERPSSSNPLRTIKYGCFTIRDRKIDHYPQSSRTYHLHNLPHDEKAAEVLRHRSRWFEFSSTTLHHTWSHGDGLSRWSSGGQVGRKTNKTRR
jgi:hypothetical protein